MIYFWMFVAMLCLLGSCAAIRVFRMNKDSISPIDQMYAIFHARLAYVLFVGFLIALGIARAV